MYAQIGGLYNDPFTYTFLGLNNQDWNKLAVEYWTPENKNNKYPGIGLECLWTQALSQVDGTFLKIQNITLGYSFKNLKIGSYVMPGLRLSLTADRPFTTFKANSFTPEVSDAEGWDTEVYPLTSTYTFGVQIDF